MNELTIFRYNDTPIRTVERDGDVWWVLKDVCTALGIVKSRDVASRLDADEKGAAQIGGLGGKQETYIINEAGLYNVILRSDKPEAKDFKRWVTHEVLPQIRKTGAYAASKSMTPAQLIAAQAQVLVEQEQRISQIAEATAEASAKTKALEERVDQAVKVFSRPQEDTWVTDMREQMRRLAGTMKWSMPKLQGALYRDLENRARCAIKSRQTRLRNRKRKAGARYKDCEAITMLDAIAADHQLRAVFESIVREWEANAYCQKDETA